MSQEILKRFWNGDGENLNSLSLLIAGDIDYDYVTVEIYHDKEYFAFIHQELGRNKLRIVFPNKYFGSQIEGIGADWFFRAVLIACGTLFVDDYIPEEKDFSIQPDEPLDKLRVAIRSNPKYDHLIAEIYYEEKHVAIIHQDLGKMRPVLVFPRDDILNIIRDLDVNWFLSSLVIACGMLVKDSPIPDIIEKPTSYEDKELS